MKRIIFLFSLFITAKPYAQDLMCGEITSQYISGFTYEATVNIYAKDTAINRDSILLNWGDSNSEILQKLTEIKVGDIRILTYKGNHTFPGQGTYLIEYIGNYRIKNIENIPYSQFVPLKLQLTVVVSSLYNNSSVEFLYPPYDIGIAGEIFSYLPGAYEPDDDTLSYSVEPPNGNGYYLPSGISINPTTGNIIWNTPTERGYVALAIQVKEWRNNLIISSTKREMLFYMDTLMALQIPFPFKSFSLDIFPNPFNNNLTVQFETPANSNYQFSIFNYTGKEISRIQRNNLPKGKHHEQINTELLTPGIYLLKANICTDAMPCVSQTLKIIKM